MRRMTFDLPLFHEAALATLKLRLKARHANKPSARHLEVRRAWQPGDAPACMSSRGTSLRPVTQHEDRRRRGFRTQFEAAAGGKSVQLLLGIERDDCGSTGSACQ